MGNEKEVGKDVVTIAHGIGGVVASIFGGPAAAAGVNEAGKAINRIIDAAVPDPPKVAEAPKDKIRAFDAPIPGWQPPRYQTTAYVEPSADPPLPAKVQTVASTHDATTHAATTHAGTPHAATTHAATTQPPVQTVATTQPSPPAPTAQRLPHASSLELLFLTYRSLPKLERMRFAKIIDETEEAFTREQCKLAALDWLRDDLTGTPLNITTGVALYREYRALPVAYRLALACAVLAKAGFTMDELNQTDLGKIDRAELGQVAPPRTEPARGTLFVQASETGSDHLMRRLRAPNQDTSES